MVSIFENSLATNLINILFSKFGWTVLICGFVRLCVMSVELAAGTIRRLLFQFKKVNDAIWDKKYSLNI